jgi:hypothetical protein
MPGILEADQELDAILLRLNSLDFGRTHLAVEGRRRGNAVQLSLVGLPADFETAAVEFRIHGAYSRRVIPSKIQRLTPLSRKCHIAALAPAREQW